MIESIFEKMIPKDCFTAEWFYSFCNELWETASKYDFNMLKESVDPQIVKTEYAKGTVGVFRGYYSPSPLYDTVIGRVKRGQLQKNYTEASTVFVYSFNSAGHLIKTEEVYHGNYYREEYIINESQLSVGFSFNTHRLKPRILSNVAIELYQNNRLVQLLIVRRDPPWMWNVICEQYSYEKDKIKEMRQYTYGSRINTPGMDGTWVFTIIPDLTDVAAPPGFINGIKYSNFQMDDGRVLSCSIKRLYHDGIPGTCEFKRTRRISFAPARVHWK